MQRTFSVLDCRQQPVVQWPIVPGQPNNIEHRPCILENQRYSFCLYGADPEEDVSIQIGDEYYGSTNENKEGRHYQRFGPNLIWPDDLYFESARGLTHIVLKISSLAQSQLPSELRFPVNVVPSKISEQRYEVMANEIHDLSAGLLVDLLGKSRSHFEAAVARGGISTRSKEAELKALVSLWNVIAPLICQIAESPSCKTIHTLQKTPHWNNRPIRGITMRQLLTQGISSNHLGRGLPSRASVFKAQSDVNINEHRTLLAFLCLMQRRLCGCHRAILHHIESIEEDRQYRDIPVKGDTTLYQDYDVPRLHRLHEFRLQAESLEMRIRSTMRIPLLETIKPGALHSPPQEFQQNALYAALRAHMNQFLEEASIWLGDEFGDSPLKLTSRMYEQWVFIRLIDAFRQWGVELEPWQDVIRESTRQRFIIDISRGLTFHGAIGRGKSLRITYEPWILPEHEARQRGASVYRGGRASVPWCPDILIERLEEGQVILAVVIDCKYAAHRTQYHDEVNKYLQIRSTYNGRQVVRQVWVALPAVDVGISCDDPAISFTESGPTCGDEETITGQIGFIPTDPKWGEPLFEIFVSGCMSYFGNLAPPNRIL